MMKKIISIAFLFGISANAMNAKAPPKDFAAITKHPIKGWKTHGSSISIYEEKLRACAIGEREEQFTKLDKFIKLCFAEKINPHWFCNRKGEISALELASRVDMEGKLVHQLMDLQFSNVPGNIAISFEAAYVDGNTTVVDYFKKLAMNGTLVPEELKALAFREQIPLKERLFFFHCFIDHLHDYFKNATLEQYIMFLETAIELDSSGECFDKLINHIRVLDDYPLNSDEVAGLFYSAYNFNNTPVLESLQAMMVLDFISPNGLIKAMLLATKATTVHFFLHNFNANLEINLHRISSQQHIELLKIACKFDNNGRDFKKLLKHINKLDYALRPKVISTLLKKAVSVKNYMSLKIMITEGLLSISHLRNLMPSKVFLAEKLFLLNYLTQSLGEYNESNFSEYRATIFKLACEIDQSGEAFTALITLGGKPKRELIEELFEIACTYKNRKVVELMNSYKLLSEIQITLFENLMSKPASLSGSF